MKITGHKTRIVFDRYDITSEEDLAEASRKLQQLTAGTIAGTIGVLSADELEERLAKSVTQTKKVVARDRIELSTLRFSVVAATCFRSVQDCSRGTFCRISGAKTEICDSVAVQNVSGIDRFLQPRCDPRGRDQNMARIRFTAATIEAIKPTSRDATRVWLTRDADGRKNVVLLVSVADRQGEALDDRTVRQRRQRRSSAGDCS
jgi:hypothetical protein